MGQFWGTQFWDSSSADYQKDGDGLPTVVASRLHTLYGLWPSFPLFSLLPPFCFLGLLSKQTTCSWDLVCKGRLRLRQDSVLLATSFVWHLWGFALGCYFVTDSSHIPCMKMKYTHNLSQMFHVIIFIFTTSNICLCFPFHFTLLYFI